MTERTYGPIDFLLVEFDGSTPATGGPGRALLDLVERGIVEVYDLLVVEKDGDGDVAVVDIATIDSDVAGDLALLAGAQSGLLDDDDVAAAGEVLEPGTLGALLVYENTWAAPFVAAVRDAGGELVAAQRITADVIQEALDEYDEA